LYESAFFTGINQKGLRSAGTGVAVKVLNLFAVVETCSRLLRWQAGKNTEKKTLRLR